MWKYIVVYTLLNLFLNPVKSLAQNITLNGTVQNAGVPGGIAAVSVLIKGANAGTFTDNNGNFKLTTDLSLPLTLVFSSVGFETKEIHVTNAAEFIRVELMPWAEIGQVIVISASRLPERILESAVTVERLGTTAIRNMAAPNFYEGIANLKGVDMTTSSLTFRTISTRGFNGSGSLKFNQLVDGMDNQAPGLNFSVGNVIGLTELDVESVELLSGASSALYGSGGLNGTLLMTSKNPFNYQGLSFQVKQGIMHTDKKYQDPAPYYDLSMRWGKVVNEKLAFKLAGQYIKARDWQARDFRNLNRNSVFSSIKDGNRESDPNYDGVNVYGDEVSYNLQSLTSIIVQGAANQFASSYQQQTGNPPSAAEINDFLSDPANGVAPFYLGLQNGLIPDQAVSRTGYQEPDMVDYNTYNLKFSGGLYYRFRDDLELSVLGNWGTGTTVYTGADRYSLRRLMIAQYKAELKATNWFLRVYTTQENAGESYNTTALASYINEAWKPSMNTSSAAALASSWYPQYIGAYLQALQGGSPDPHQAARQFADQGRFLPGSPEFKETFEQLRKRPISEQGALFLDKTDLWQVDGQLNLTDKVKFAEVLVGGNYRKYLLKSEGTLFNDGGGKIPIDEFGGFLQVQKRLFNEVLKLTASGRYDKSKNFEGRITPRVSAVIKIEEAHHIRLSVQTAYRFPSTQDQYINLFTGTSTLIGGLPAAQEEYGLISNPAYTAGSIAEFRNTYNPAVLQPAQYKPLVPETSLSYEIGYKSVFAGKLFLDVYGYLSEYRNFIGRVAVVQPAVPGAAGIEGLAIPARPYSNNFSYPQNSDNNVKSIGYGLSFEYWPGKGYRFSGNIAGDQLQNVPEGLVTFFNAPKFRFNAAIANQDMYKGLGFNLSYRWQDEVYWEGTFGTGIVPAYGSLDAQISYRIPKTKHLLKLGSGNVLNDYYRSAFGNPEVGGLYYVSFGWNVF